MTPPSPAERPRTPPHRCGTKLPHRVASAVVEDIVGRGLEAGEWLPSEPELAERFGGQSRLRPRGAARARDLRGRSDQAGKNGGNEVGTIDADAFARTLALFFRMARATYRDLMDARIVIEPFMTRRAAERRDIAFLAELRVLLEREAASTAGTAEGDRLALGFHRLICGASGNPVMDALGRAIHALYGDRLAANLLYAPGCWTTARQIHQEIGEAILAGDGRTAQELMAGHMEDFRALQEERTPWLLDELVAWTP